MLSHKQPVLHLFVFHFIYLGGGLCAELCAELYPSRRCRNVLTEHKHSDSTWKRMSQWSQVDKKKEKQLNLSPRRYAAENPQYGIWIPPSLPSPRQRAAPSISCGPENSPGWCTVAYWSPESQMALLSAARVLVGFINNPGLVRDTDGHWPMCLLYSNPTSYKKRKCLEISLHIYHLSSPGLFITHFPCQMLLDLI